MKFEYDTEKVNFLFSLLILNVIFLNYQQQNTILLHTKYLYVQLCIYSTLKLLVKARKASLQDSPFVKRWTKLE